MGRAQGCGSGDRRRGVCPCPDESLAGLLTRELTEAQLVSHGVQARLVHAEEIMQGAVGDPLFALEQRYHRQEYGMELALGLRLLVGGGRRGGGCSRPDEDLAFLIRRDAAPRSVPLSDRRGSRRRG